MHKGVVAVRMKTAVEFKMQSCRPNWTGPFLRISWDFFGNTLHRVFSRNCGFL